MSCQRPTALCPAQVRPPSPPGPHQRPYHFSNLVFWMTELTPYEMVRHPHLPILDANVVQLPQRGACHSTELDICRRYLIARLSVCLSASISFVLCSPPGRDALPNLPQLNQPDAHHQGLPPPLLLQLHHRLPPHRVRVMREAEPNLSISHISLSLSLFSHLSPPPQQKGMPDVPQALRQPPVAPTRPGF